MLFKSNFVLALMLVLCCCCFVSVGGRRGRGKVTKIEEFADADSASDINEEEREGKLCKCSENLFLALTALSFLRN